MVEVDTTFEDFNAVVIDDPRCATLDPGNIKLAFNSVSYVMSFLPCLLGRILAMPHLPCKLYMQMQQWYCFCYSNLSIVTEIRKALRQSVLNLGCAQSSLKFASDL